MIRDKGQTGFEVRSRLFPIVGRVLPFGEEDFVREAGRNDGNGGLFLLAYTRGRSLDRSSGISRNVLSKGRSPIYYANDTLLLATGRGWAEVHNRAEFGQHLALLGPKIRERIVRAPDAEPAGSAGEG